MRVPIEARLTADGEWVDGELTTDHKAGFPVVLVDGLPNQPNPRVSIRGVVESDAARWLLKRAKEEGFTVEP